MILALILPLFLAGTPANIGRAPSDDPAVQLWINNDGRFLPGDHTRVEVQAKDDGYLLVLHVAPDGYLQVLFPLDPGDDNFVRGGERFEVKDRDGRDAFDIDGTWGPGMVYAAVSHDQFRFDGYQLGDYWDYRTLARSGLPRDPEPELTDLVGRMAPGDFDYDVITYDVIERVVRGSDYSSVPSDFVVSTDFFFDPFFNPFLFDPFVHGGFFFDPFFHRGFFFNPFFRDPFFHQGFFFLDPFRFDPFLTSRFFFDPFFGGPFFGGPFFRQPALIDPFFHQPFFFHPRGHGRVPYRDRRGDFRSAVNTDQLMPWRSRGAAAAGQGRQVELRGERPVRPAVPDARRRVEARRDNWPVDVSPRLRGRGRVTEARRNNWPVDVSPRSRGLVGEARRNNWPVDVSPRSRGLVSEARRNNWPVDVSPRRRDPGRPTGVRPQIDGSSLYGARRAWGVEGRSGLRMAPSDRGGWGRSSPQQGRGGYRGGWASPSGRGGGRGFGPSVAPAMGGGRGSSGRR